MRNTAENGSRQGFALSWSLVSTSSQGDFGAWIVSQLVPFEARGMMIYTQLLLVFTSLATDFHVWGRCGDIAS